MTYPDVPNLPGVPQLARDPSASAAAQASASGIDADFTNALASADGAGLPADAAQEAWGIYTQSGALAVHPGSIVGVDLRNEARVADYPMEQGAFGSYNKVATPFDFRITMAFAGNATQRETFLSEIDTLLQTTDLYNVAMPEALWENVTIDNYDWRRDSQSGVQMLTVNVYARQVRQVNQDSYTQAGDGSDLTQGAQTLQTVQDASVTPFDAANTHAVDAADLKNQGRVQAMPPTPAQDGATNFASASANDGMSAAVSSDAINWNPGALALGDMLGNAPAGMSANSSAAYASTIKLLYGGTA
ncbi:MAG: hypothetical protein LBH10_03540 [Burkholderiaceae bacterium]|jgi:hypothetical protein|nr:hypothetical protein [Burkholderiaceae bacterium]